MTELTHYILAGGSDRAYDGFGEKLAHEITSLVPEPKILSCFFSQDESMWDEKFQGWGDWLKQFFGSNFEYQNASPDRFLEQIEWADVVYLHGGTTLLLETAMKQYPDIESAFKGKIIVGSSAGTNFLSKTYFSPKRNHVGKGSGILDINTIVHFGADSDGEVSLTQEEWNAVVGRMKTAVGDEAIVLLREGEFISIVQ